MIATIEILILKLLMLNIVRILQNFQNLGPFGTILGVDHRVLLSLNWLCNVTGGVKIWKFENLDIIVFPMPKLVYMQIFYFLFHFIGKLLTFDPQSGHWYWNVLEILECTWKKNVLENVLENIYFFTCVLELYWKFTK